MLKCDQLFISTSNIKHHNFEWFEYNHRMQLYEITYRVSFGSSVNIIFFLLCSTWFLKIKPQNVYKTHNKPMKYKNNNNYIMVLFWRFVSQKMCSYHNRYIYILSKLPCVYKKKLGSPFLNKVLFCTNSFDDLIKIFERIY